MVIFASRCPGFAKGTKGRSVDEISPRECVIGKFHTRTAGYQILLHIWLSTAACYVGEGHTTRYLQGALDGIVSRALQLATSRRSGEHTRTLPKTLEQHVPKPTRRRDPRSLLNKAAIGLFNTLACSN